MKRTHLSEQEWLEVYDTIYEALLEALLRNDKTEADARKVMEEIKTILVSNEQPEPMNYY